MGNQGPPQVIDPIVDEHLKARMAKLRLVAGDEWESIEQADDKVASAQLSVRAAQIALAQAQHEKMVVLLELERRHRRALDAEESE